MSDGRQGRQDPGLTDEVNRGALASLLRNARDAGVSKFVLASTFGVYGDAYARSLTENLEPRPVEPYSESKARAEDLVRESDASGFETISLRSAMVCGWSPRTRFDLLVNAMTRRALVKGTIDILGGEQRRPQIHVDDLCEAFATVLSAPEGTCNREIFNVGSSNPSLRSLGEAIRRLSPGNVSVRSLPERAGERSFVLDCGKIERSLGFAPRRGVDDAIRSIVDAFSAGHWRPEDDPGGVSD